MKEMELNFHLLCCHILNIGLKEKIAIFNNWIDLELSNRIGELEKLTSLRLPGWIWILQFFSSNIYFFNSQMPSNSFYNSGANHCKTQRWRGKPPLETENEYEKGIKDKWKGKKNEKRRKKEKRKKKEKKIGENPWKYKKAFKNLNILHSY